MSAAKTFAVLAIAALGVSLLTVAALPKVHQMSLRLPGGATETISYVGAVPPPVLVMPAPGDPRFVEAADAGTTGSPLEAFAAFDAMAAAFDRNFAGLEADDLDGSGVTASDGLPDPLSLAATTGAGAGSCVRAVTITIDAAGRRHTDSRAFGDCAMAARPSADTGAATAVAPPLVPPAASDGGDLRQTSAPAVAKVSRRRV